MSKSSGEMRLMPDELKTGDIIELDQGFWTEITSMQRKIARGVTATTVETSYGERITLKAGHLYHCWRVGEERREAKLEELGPAHRMGTAVKPPAKALTDFIAEHAEPERVLAPHDGVVITAEPEPSIDFGTHYVGDGCKPEHTGWPYPLEEPVDVRPEIPAAEPAGPDMQTHYDKRPPPVMPVTEAERRRYAIDVITDAIGHRPHTLDVTVEGEHHVPGFLTLRAEDFILIAATLEDHR